MLITESFRPHTRINTFLTVASGISGFTIFYWLTWQAIDTLHPAAQIIGYLIWAMNAAIFAVACPWLLLLAISSLRARMSRFYGPISLVTTRRIGWTSVALVVTIALIFTASPILGHLVAANSWIRVYIRYQVAVAVFVGSILALASRQKTQDELPLKEYSPKLPRIQLKLSWVIAFTTVLCCIVATVFEKRLVGTKLLSGFGFLSAPWSILLVGRISSLLHPSFRLAGYCWSSAFFVGLAIVLGVTAISSENTYGVPFPSLLLLPCFLWPPQIMGYLLLRPLLAHDSQPRTANQLVWDAGVVALSLICFGYSLAFGGVEVLWSSLKHLV